jgi:hypothetical protein
MKRIDNDPASHLKALIYGKPGVGKTNLAVSAPKPLILLSEAQGLVHVRGAAERLGKAMPQTLLIESVDDLRASLKALMGNKEKPLKIGGIELEWPETIALDSLTDYGHLVKQEIREQSPPKPGRDGLPVDAQRYWGVMGDRMTNLILAFRNLPFHVVFLALLDDREEGEEDAKVRVVGPDMPMRKLAGVVAAAVNVIGIATRGTKEGEPVYSVVTNGPDYMTLKPYRPLRNKEIPDMTYWIDRLAGKCEERAI